MRGQNAVIRYLLSSMIFPVGVAWLGVGFLVSKLMPQKFQWAGPKVRSHAPMKPPMMRRADSPYLENVSWRGLEGQRSSRVC